MKNSPQTIPADETPEEARRRKKKEYMRGWWAKNRERKKFLSKRYREKHKEAIAKRDKEKKSANPEYYKARQRAYRKRTQPEKREERAAASREWAARNREKTRETKRRWRINNPDRAAYLAARRRVKKHQAMPSWVDEDAIDQIYKTAREMSAAEGVQYSVDHMVPLIHHEVCGLHVPWNLRIIPLVDNIIKNNKFISEISQPANIEALVSGIRATE